MRDTEATRKWQRLPENPVTHKKIDPGCRICGEPITAGDDYEVVKHKSPRGSAYFHTACIRKEAQNNGTT